jgi:chemosensory pili system protein ChpC
MMDAMPTATKTVASSQIPSLLIPTGSRTLILPTVSVAEMLPYKKPQLRGVEINQYPSWFLGKVQWRGVMVPMFSYEAVSGDAIPALKATSQMTILNNTGVNLQLPFLCFPTQGIPKLSRVTSETIKEDTSQPLNIYDEMHIIVNDELATIPSIAKLEQLVANLLGFEA